jgi:hypothetical protein
MKNILFVLFLFSALTAYSQNNDTYLIPKDVYVGDPATLILPLTGQKYDHQDIILTAGFPIDPRIDFHRIILEKRVSGSRLLIEFTAFIPGYLQLPVIEIGGEYFPGLSINIKSTIDSASATAAELSVPAFPLAAPGTAFMIYGTITSSVLLIIFIIWFALYGRHDLKKLLLYRKRLKIFSTMNNVRKRLYQSLLKGVKYRDILDSLVFEFRFFLSCFFASNCGAMTAGELEALPVELETGNDFLGRFFRSCDTLRFSGEKASKDDILVLLEGLGQFLVSLEKHKTGETA